MFHLLKLIHERNRYGIVFIKHFIRDTNKWRRLAFFLHICIGNIIFWVKRVDLDVDVDFIFTSFKIWDLSIQFAIENFLNRSIAEAKHIKYLGFLFFRQYLLFTIQH